MTDYFCQSGLRGRIPLLSSAWRFFLLLKPLNGFINVPNFSLMFLPSFPSDTQRSRAHAQSKRHFMLWLAISKQSTMTMDRAHAQSKRHFMLWLAISKQSTMTMDRARLFV